MRIRRFPPLALLALVVAVAGAARAQTPRLVRDINPGPLASNPDQITCFRGVAFFRAFTPRSGVELWRSDGTAAGTALVKETRVGVASGTPAELTVAGDRLFFRTVLAGGAGGLWVSDGTTAGTRLLASFPNAAANPRRLTAVGARLFFRVVFRNVSG